MVDKIINLFFVKEDKKKENYFANESFFDDLKEVDREFFSLKKETKIQNENQESLFPYFNNLKGLNVKERLYYNR